MEQELADRATNPLASIAKDPTDKRRNAGIKLKVVLDFVDDLNEEVNLNVSVCLHYHDDKAMKYVTGKGGFTPVDPQETDIFVPVVDFLQARSADHIEGFKLLVSNRTGTVFLFRVYRLVIHEIFELQRFPFDRQVVKVWLV